MNSAYFTPEFPLGTARLEFRPFAETDLDALHGIHSRPDVVAYLPWSAHEDLDASREMLAGRMARQCLSQDGEKLILAIVDRSDGALVGDIALILVNRASHQGEIGFILHPDRQGRGLAREATAGIMRVGFEAAGFRRLIGRCDARNHRSAHLMQALGMRREACFRRSEWRKGRWIDTLVFAKLDDEWRIDRR